MTETGRQLTIASVRYWVGCLARELCEAHLPLSLGHLAAHGLSSATRRLPTSSQDHSCQLSRTKLPYRTTPAVGV